MSIIFALFTSIQFVWAGPSIGPDIDQFNNSKVFESVCLIKLGGPHGEICTGTLVPGNRIKTAGHCILGRKNADLSVRCGCSETACKEEFLVTDSKLDRKSVV